jgi:uncharacterized protein (DUF1778 family)
MYTETIMAPKPETKQEKKTETLKIRINSTQRDLIDMGANLKGITRSAFILEAARREAEEAILEQTVFALEPEQWKALNEALDNPPEENEKLALLFASKTPW